MKAFPILPTAAVLVACFFVAVTRAPAAEIGAPRGGINPGADAAWETLQDSLQRQNAATLATREARVRAALQQASQLQAFQETHPAHPAARAAKQQEALLLLHAAYGGDTSQETRRAQLVAEVRADASLPVSERSKVAAYADNLGVVRQEKLTRAERLAAFEAVVRGLIAEFPEVPTGYESLWRIAEATSPERAHAVASELLATPAAPEFVRGLARTFLEGGGGAKPAEAPTGRSGAPVQPQS